MEVTVANIVASSIDEVFVELIVVEADEIRAGEVIDVVALVVVAVVRMESEEDPEEVELGEDPEEVELEEDPEEVGLEEEPEEVGGAEIVGVVKVLVAVEDVEGTDKAVEMVVNGVVMDMELVVLELVNIDWPFSSKSK